MVINGSPYSNMGRKKVLNKLIRIPKLKPFALNPSGRNMLVTLLNLTARDATCCSCRIPFGPMVIPRYENSCCCGSTSCWSDTRVVWRFPTCDVHTFCWGKAVPVLFGVLLAGPQHFLQMRRGIGDQGDIVWVQKRRNGVITLTWLSQDPQSAWQLVDEQGIKHRAQNWSLEQSWRVLHFARLCALNHNTRCVKVK